MVRSTLTAFALVTIAGGAALAQQSHGDAAGKATGTAPAASTTRDTGLIGVYSTKRTLGIATGQGGTAAG